MFKPAWGEMSAEGEGEGGHTSRFVPHKTIQFQLLCGPLEAAEAAATRKQQQQQVQAAVAVAVAATNSRKCTHTGTYTC